MMGPVTPIPESHPRAVSLRIRQRLVEGFDGGLVAAEGLLAHGRGEAFDYLLGERTGRAAARAIRAAAARLLLSRRPVISINGNAAALCPAQMVALAEEAGAKLEINLFYDSPERRRAIAGELRNSGAADVLGEIPGGPSAAKLSGTDSARGTVDRNGILAADTVVVPLEDGDRTAALRDAGKTVIAIDLNPLSRTAQTASITIVDNIVRAAGLLADEVGRLSAETGGQDWQGIVDRFDNGRNLRESVLEINDSLTGAAGRMGEEGTGGA